MGKRLLRIAISGSCLLAGSSFALPAEGVAARPFERPLAADDATLFSELPSEVTGIVVENDYADPSMWRETFREFLLGAIGAGVAIGDYDEDGMADVFVVSKTGSNRLFRNLGGWRFEDVTEAAGLGDASSAWCQGASFADIDNDGDLDLYVCRFKAANLLYLNNGDGTFEERAEEAGVAVVDASGMVSFADYDRDGDLDFYLQTNVLSFDTGPDGQEDYLFRNRGDGVFEDVTKAAGISGSGQGHSATWFDYNQDGWPDLYVANDFSPADAFYHNNGDGTFSNRLSLVFPHTPNSSMGADVGDVNNDGLIDLIVGDMATLSHEKDMRGMVDGRAEANDRAHPAFAAPQVPRNALFLNSGMSRFTEAAILAGVSATDWTWSLRFEDLDNDGLTDLHVTTGMARELHNADLVKRMQMANTLQARAAVVRASPRLEEANLAYRNLGDLSFEEVGKAWGLDQFGISFGAAFGDLDNDGDLDLVFTNYDAPPTVLRNNSVDGERIIFDLRSDFSNRFGIGSEVTIEADSGAQTKSLVTARGYLASSEPAIHFGLGEDRVARRVTIRWPSGRIQILENLGAGKRYLIKETGESEKPEPIPRPRFEETSRAMNLLHPAREENEPDELALQPLLPRRLNRLGPAIAVADVDGDGYDEVVLGGTTIDPTRLLTYATEGWFFDHGELGIVGSDRVNTGPLLLFDADGDGDEDLLASATGVVDWGADGLYQLRLMLNNGSGHFQEATQGTLPRVEMSVGAVAAADFDRDGRLDVFVGGRVLPGTYPLSPRSVLLRNTKKGFVDVASDLAEGLTAAGMVTSALWSDVDRDGWLDLLLAREWGGVALWRNVRGERFEERSEAFGFDEAGSGWWTALAGADFNGDGRIDYALGNVGLNTPYSASKDEPATLFYLESSEPSGARIVEARYWNGELVPVRGRNQVGAAFPEVAERFPSSNLYAKATLAEILGEERLRGVRKFTATEFSSGVLLSEAGGGFRFQALPRMVQIAPVQGMAAGDFDGDGLADLYLLHNSYAPIPEVGRFDGGLSLMLKGDGEGGFAVAPTRESGLFAPGDAKALAVIDLNRDRWPDFVLTRNNSASLAYRNRPISSSDYLVTRLEGNAENRDAIGARVELLYANGRRSASEVYAGVGHFSQSTKVLFWGIPAGSEVARIEVFWPDGGRTVKEGPFGAGMLVLSHPEEE